MCKLAFDLVIASNLKVLFQTQQSFEFSLTVSTKPNFTLYKPLQVARLQKCNVPLFPFVTVTNKLLPGFITLLCCNNLSSLDIQLWKLILYIHSFNTILFHTELLHNVTITSSGVPISGGTYNLTCTVEVNVPPTVQWLYSSNGTAVTNGSNITVETQTATGSTTTLTLAFSPLHTSHRGLYTCQSTIHSPASTVNATRNMTVQGDYSSKINCLNMLGRVCVQRTGYKLTRKM